MWRIRNYLHVRFLHVVDLFVNYLSCRFFMSSLCSQAIYAFQQALLLLAIYERTFCELNYQIFQAFKMFFIPSLLMRRNEPLAIIWRIVFDEKWRPSRKIILEVNVQRACELLIGKIPNGNPGEIKFSLYLLAQLAYGVALIVQKQGDILCRDMETFIPIIRRYQYEKENESLIKGKKDRKKRVSKLNDTLMLNSSFETIENEHLKVVLDYSAITLREDIPLPEIDTMFNDDFGPLTAAEAQQMEALLNDDIEHVIESKSGSTNGSKEFIMNVVPEALATNTTANKTTHLEQIFEMMEVSDESEIRKERQYDLGSDETLQESEIKHPTCLSIIELSDVHESQMEIPKKKRRKHGIIIDEVTMFNKAQLQAQIDSSHDLLYTRDEMISQIPKSGIVTVQDLFNVHPVTLREFSKNPVSNLNAWITAPEYDEPPLQYEEAMQLEPMQAPPMRMLQNLSAKREMSTESMSHASLKSKLQNLERQITPVMEDIEYERRNTTSTAAYGSTRTADPSSQLRSDAGLPIASSDSRQFDDKMKMSVAFIFERTAEKGSSQARVEDSLILSTEKARVTDLFSNLAVESELRGTRLESSTENVLIDEGYPQYGMREDVSQKEIPKMSMMQDPFQLKVSRVESTVETGDSSIPVYYQAQKADDLFRLITEFLDSHKGSAVCFSELIHGRSAVFAAKAFTNLLQLLAERRVKKRRVISDDWLLLIKSFRRIEQLSIVS
ncbi:Meiotic recombination protein [Dirofilaria immitis]